MITSAFSLSFNSKGEKGCYTNGIPFRQKTDGDLAFQKKKKKRVASYKPFSKVKSISLAAFQIALYIYKASSYAHTCTILARKFCFRLFVLLHETVFSPSCNGSL